MILLQIIYMVTILTMLYLWSRSDKDWIRVTDDLQKVSYEILDDNDELIALVISSECEIKRLSADNFRLTNGTPNVILEPNTKEEALLRLYAALNDLRLVREKLANVRTERDMWQKKCNDTRMRHNRKKIYKWISEGVYGTEEIKEFIRVSENERDVYRKAQQNNEVKILGQKKAIVALENKVTSLQEALDIAMKKE